MLLLKRSNRFIYIIFCLLILGNAYAAESICNEDESSFFSCTMKNGKQLAICGIEKNNLLLINYKYGNAKKAELIFPPSPQHDNDLFKYNHYIRYQTDYFRIVFLNDEYEYEVYRSYDTDISNEIIAGVNVSHLPSSKVYNNQCKTLQIDKMNLLAGLLDCDDDSALGCSSDNPD